MTTWMGSVRTSPRLAPGSPHHTACLFAGADASWRKCSQIKYLRSDPGDWRGGFAMAFFRTSLGTAATSHISSQCLTNQGYKEKGEENYTKNTHENQQAREGQKWIVLEKRLQQIPLVFVWSLHSTLLKLACSQFTP